MNDYKEPKRRPWRDPKNYEKRLARWHLDRCIDIHPPKKIVRKLKLIDVKTYDELKTPQPARGMGVEAGYTIRRLSNTGFAHTTKVNDGTPPDRRTVR